MSRSVLKKSSPWRCMEAIGEYRSSRRSQIGKTTPKQASTATAIEVTEHCRLGDPFASFHCLSFFCSHRYCTCHWGQLVNYLRFICTVGLRNSRDSVLSKLLLTFSSHLRRASQFAWLPVMTASLVVLIEATTSIIWIAFASDFY